jgi:hypothetical protein
MRYFQHKEKSSVICELINNSLRFGKWVWNGDTCIEVYTFKDYTKDIDKVFKEITQEEYNSVWGVNLNDA